MDSSNEHIVMLPFMAQGHLIPFLSLAKQIHHRTGFKITIVSTPLNILYLKSTISKHEDQNTSNSLIHLFELPFNGTDYGLPNNIENTEALPLNLIVNLFHASTSLEVPFRDLISDIVSKEGSPPLCIISDVFIGWTNGVAKSFGTVNVSFTTCGGYGTAAYVSLWQNLPHRSSGSDEFRLPGFPDSCCFHVSQLHQFLRNADGNDSWSRFFQPQISLSVDSYGWLCNTVEEIEPLGLEILRNYIKIPVWTIGPLLPPAMLVNEKSSSSTSRDYTIIGQRTGRQPGISPKKCIEWLDLHPQRSVLYISFGSQNTISKSQMMELAKGLEESGKPFIWVIRPPFGFDLRGEFKPEWLPEGFEERMCEGKRGLLIHKWAPQLEILAHKSTAAFLSHCGWNSILESLSQGVSLIGWPLAAEQAYNSKMLMEDMEVCVELTRGVHSCIAKEEVRKVVDLVVGKEEKGREMRRKAVEIGRLIKAAVKEDGGGKGSSLKAMDDFVASILFKRQQQQLP